MKYALVADDGQARVVISESSVLREIRLDAEVCCSDGVRIRSTCKFRVCRREPSANGENLVTIETWEKGQKV